MTAIAPEKLTWFNQLDTATCREELTRCCGATRWVEGMLARRPFTSVEDLFAAADQVWIWLYEDDWLEAFTHHPKIGDLESLRKKFATTAGWASGEQSGVQSASEGTLQGLADGNRRYEEKFGYIFIVCATGKTADEMLAILTKRLDNEPAVELQLAAVEQQKITRLRLEKLLS
jgi:2-oxo-4-hydroxy-4-carboxy-5-ureidoimidazoline decarboxylase